MVGLITGLYELTSLLNDMKLMIDLSMRQNMNIEWNLKYHGDMSVILQHVYQIQFVLMKVMARLSLMMHYPYSRVRLF